LSYRFRSNFALLERRTAESPLQTVDGF